MRAHYNELRAKGIRHSKALEMADPARAHAERRARTLRIVSIALSIFALVVLAVRWVEVRADETIAAQAEQIEQLEYMIAACQSTGGFHIGGSWHRCVLREVGK